MTTLDYAILAVYLAAIVGLGSSFSKNQKSLREYLLGGKSIPWWAAACSGVATMASAVGYLGAPGQAFHSDLTYLQMRFAIPGVILIVCLLFIPLFYRLDVYTAYEYLERRFDLKTRLLASTLFVLLKASYLAVVIYAPALVVAEMTGFSVAFIVLIAGLATTFYTMMGGIRAVVWTDTLQLVIFIGGAVAAFSFLLASIDGGMTVMFQTAAAENKLRFFDFSPSLTTEFTFWGGLIGGTFFMLTQYGVDQAELQRFLTSPSVADGRRAVAWTIVVSAIYGILLFLIGSALYVFYLQHPDKGAMALKADRVFPKFILEELPAGVRGLLIAGVLSAGMSTVSAVLNSLTTVTLRDFYERLTGRAGTVRLARAITLAIGGLSTFIALFGESFGGLLVAAGKISNFFGGSLVGVFLLGILAPSVGGTAAFTGALIGFAGVVVIATMTPVAWLWYSVFSTALCVGSALALSRLFPALHKKEVTAYDAR